MTKCKTKWQTKWLAVVAVLVVVGLGCGCTMFREPVPQNTIQVSAPDGATWTVKTRKNVDIRGLEASLDTNRTFRLRVDSWSSTNDAVVIRDAFSGQAEVVSAMANGFTQLATNVVATAIKATAAAAGP